MKLIAVKLTGDVGYPIPVFVKEDVESDPTGVKAAESGHPATPFENLPPGLDVPRNQPMFLNRITQNAICAPHRGLNIFRNMFREPAHTPDHRTLHATKLGVRTGLL